MLLTIHNLPLNMRYGDIKDLLKDKCGLTDLILDKLTKDGDSKKVTVGVADDGDAAILVRKINGLYLGNLQLYVEDARKKQDSEQPFRTSSMMNTGNFLQPPQVRMPANNIQQQQQTPYAEDIQTRFSSESQQRYPNNNQSNQKRFPNDNNYNQTRYNSDQKSGGSNFQNNYAATSAINMPMAAAAMYPAADQMSQLQGTAAMYAMQQQQMMANYQMMGYYMPQVPDQNYSTYAAGNQAVATNMPQDIPQNTDWPVQPSGNDWEEPPMETEPEYRGRNQSDRRPRPRRSRSPLQPQNDRFDFGNRYEPANDRGRDDRPVESGRPSRFHDKDADFGNAGGFDRNGRRDRSPPRKMSRFDRDNKTDFLLPPGHNSGPRPAFGGRNHRDEPPAQRGLGQEESFGPRGSRPSRFERSDDRAPKRRYDETRSGPRFDESRSGPRFEETRSGPRFEETRSGPRFDEARSGPRFDETRSGPRFDEARSGPRFDETRSGPRFDEARSGPRFDAPTREPYPKAFPVGRAERPDRNFTQKERGFKQSMPERFEDSRGPRDPMSNPRPTVQLTPEQLAIKQQNRLNTYRGMATATILKEVLQGRRPLEVPEQRALKQAIRAKVDGINVPRKTPVPILKEEIIRLYRQRYSTAGDTKFFHAVMRDFKKDLESALAEGEPVHDKSIEKPTGNGTRPPRQESRPEPNSIIKQKPVKGGKAKPSKSMKSVFKTQKQLQKLEYSGQTVYTLEPHLEKALEEEIDILGEVVKESCEAPQDDADTVVYNHINDVANDDFKQTLSIDVKKRILNIKSGLTLRVFFNPRPPKRPVFDEHMKKYGVVSVKKSERGKFWLIAVNSYANYDKLFALQTTTIEGSTVNFKPLHVGGPPPKLTRDQFKQIKKARVASKIHDYDEEKFVVLDQDFSTDVIESEEPVKTPTRAKEITQKSGVLNENDLNDLLNVNEEDLVDY
ncbi:unnamed protein product [Plutella xylostella]|uniref:(diamondback moth) hypothetical protein n=1 Tax=Plutella xylostella TaxID=51655 RepID=A0A8S4EKT2_PLUXY|nr:unnamed protein product [Plutella xylostella]